MRPPRSPRDRSDRSRLVGDAVHTFIRTVETDTAADLVWAYLADFTTINE